MKSKFVVEIPTYSEGDSSFPKPVTGNYDYWVPILSYFLEESDMIEIHCWNEEAETIKEVKSLHKGLELASKGHLTIIKGSKTDAITDYLLNNHLSNRGDFKWFTVNLIKEYQPLFHSGHWGTQFFAEAVTEEEIAFITSVLPEESNLLQY
ncbi:hypothetical protein H1D32_02325 [Anaerobacillus sp. CMMVII]|uniref:hypothetical protein n=1 Tax=Anaerobacillus sp. CMMVII TaxID=2755588 RepID=UPI0021B793C7|nr:hypothetical protein [Anaerobacillus sp. CMMVII]MCT8136685.1 hypothetical protein [Anaerobacillus sp. CMMVII]